MRRFAARAVVLLLLVLPGPGSADPVEDLATAMRIDDLLKIVRDEGLQNAADILPKDAQGAVPDAVMQAALAAFDPIAMQTEMRVALRAHMDAAMLAEATTFFTTEPGSTLVKMELSARRAIMDPDIEDVSRLNWKERTRKADPHVDAIERFARINDLVGRNATGTMVAHYEFLQGMAAGGSLQMDGDAALNELWSREDEIVAETEGWLMAFLLLAYGPVPTDYIDAYSAFSLGPTGEALNDAVFAGFEASYRRIAFELGRIAGTAETARDL